MKFFTKFFFYFILAISIYSCQKDHLDISTKNNSDGSSNQILAISGQEIPSGPGKTILGDKLNNPYAVDNISLALQTIYGQSFNLSPSHYYIRMRPSNAEDVQTMENLDLDWEDQPLDYEIVYQGEYFIDDDIPENVPDWSYATVSSSFQFPNINYEILDELFIPPYHSHLTFKAFQLSGNEDKYEGVTVGDCTPRCFNYPHCIRENVSCQEEVDLTKDLCDEGCDNWPDCSFDANIPCNDDENNDNGNNSDNDNIPCDENNPLWPDCLLVEGSDVEDTTTDACGCFNLGPITYPTGRVTVDDTVLGEEGVRLVKVKAKPNRFFSHIWRSDYTDNNGCFKIDHSYTSNSIKVKVKFKNPYFNLKAWQNGATIFAYQSRTEVIVGSDYSDICISFIRGGDNTIQTRDWQAATIANTVAEFHDWELPLPDQRLTIWIDRGGNFAAPMLGLANNIAFCLDEIVLGDGNILDYYQFAQQLAGNALGLPAHLVSFYTPDVVLSDRSDSDRLRRIVFHELAHVSHYTIAGECYWRKIRAHESFMALAIDDPYGDPSNIPIPPPAYMNFPIVALAESWAEHVGFLYNVRKYGDTNSSYADDLESLRVVNNFIPEGLHQDLIDELSNPDASFVNGVFINDSAEGATLAELYQLLENETVVGYRSDVISGTSASGNIQFLFSQYGY